MPGRKTLGVYHYDKRLRSGRLQHVRVQVFPLEVREEAETFPEQGQRDRLWTSPGEASGMVDEPELRKLLAAFRPRAGGCASPGTAGRSATRPR
jgi:hypothetical protein